MSLLDLPGVSRLEGRVTWLHGCICPAHAVAIDAPAMIIDVAG